MCCWLTQLSHNAMYRLLKQNYLHFFKKAINPWKNTFCDLFSNQIKRNFQSKVKQSSLSATKMYYCALYWVILLHKFKFKFLIHFTIMLTRLRFFCLTSGFSTSVKNNNNYLLPPCRARPSRYDDSTDWPFTNHVTTVESASWHPVSTLQNTSSPEPKWDYRQMEIRLLFYQYCLSSLCSLRSSFHHSPCELSNIVPFSGETITGGLSAGAKTWRRTQLINRGKRPDSKFAI